MKEKRSASQVLFGYLPEQTVDLRNGVWKIKDWRTPIVRNDIDDESLRRAIQRQVTPWRNKGMDGGFYAALQSGAKIETVTLDPDNGVDVEPFPKSWICNSCGRVHDTPDANCRCGKKVGKGQLFFVGYHEACGAIKAPYIPRCPTHNDVAVAFPGTASATEIRFFCPVCDTTVRQGFGFTKCSCGQGNLSYQPHRAASVYTPRAVVIVNPPSKEKIRAVLERGGPPKALKWIVDGMKTRTMEELPATRESLRQTLIAQGLPGEMIERMLDLAGQSGDASVQADVSLPDLTRADAEAQAVTIALAMSSSRVTTDDLVSGSEDQSDLGNLYRSDYARAMRVSHVEGIELVERFPVLTGQFGYTRGKHEPGAGRLVPYRSRSGYRVYADMAETEALFVRLDPIRVATWLTQRGHVLPAWNDSRSARIAILKSAVLPDAWADRQRDIGADLLELVHSYTHRFLRITATFAGIDRNALSELLVPLHLGFFVYAAARGDFVLGGLQAVFETELHRLLEAVVTEERRCPLDPGCKDSGGACLACLHVGEPSCRYFNRYLSRDALFGQSGYLSASL
ncbi:hypothetical protein ACQZ32_09290 [Ralstonia pseudosolanacearum]|uniref:hypothetical protein n=1 Tax=Ralstonia pseudosolanacearum TaxID=1310165 RepID=UPI0009BDA66A|nr:hypothetical protein [Ralstonia pseudosolanacearum]MDC6295119.1 hypothetical protein [Ralstonia pseudosolanacearum]MDD7789499.1 hypothetical protein [Ralstonia pseudosolanacearum]MDN3370047.1 hypothetical protein [Ralstonia pseudosolanacearum]QOK85161.1 hypothetical protein HF907_00030 [Ralstonia pseudosolanacearum]